jgi:hypothetical protein
LFRNGYLPVPVSSPWVDCKSAGKRPLMSDWRQKCAEATEEDIASWEAGYRNCGNTGILTNNLRAIDIDVYDADLAGKLLELAFQHFGPTPLVRTGQAPKVLAVWAAADHCGKQATEEYVLPNGKKARIEILATGQQFVGFGEHPDTGTNYLWHDNSPEDVPVCDLETISSDAAEWFIKAADELIVQAGGVLVAPKVEAKPVGSPKVNRIHGDGFFYNVNGAALSSLDRWVPRLFRTAKLQETGAWRITAADLGRDLEEDLSIHPAGIQDWGKEKPETPINLVIEHGGASDAKEAAFWLCEQIGIDPVSLGWTEKRAPAPEIPPPQSSSENPAAGEDQDKFHQPFDLFGDADLTGIPVMPSQCVPDVIEAFAMDESARLGTDPAMIAAGCLVACAAVIDDEWKLQPKDKDDSWTESARLWLATIAPPSAKKTPALKASIGPLEKIDEDYSIVDAPLHEQYEVDMKVYAAKLSRHSALVANNEDSEQPEKPTAPPNRRLVVNNVTVPKLQEILIDNPAGVICVYDELATWFCTFDSRDNGDKDKAEWLSSYNGGPLIVDRIKRGTGRIPNWSACLIGTIQPDRLREITAKMSNDGLMQRFMLIYAQSSGRGVDRAPVGPCISNYKKLISDLAGMKRPPREAPFKLSETAQVHRSKLLDVIDLISILPDTPEPLKYHMGKWEGLFTRLCLTYHMVEAASSDKPPAPTVSGATAGRVFMFMRDLLLPNLMKFYREMFNTSPNLEYARWIAGYIISNGKQKVSQRDIYRAYSSKVREKPQLINDAMRLLDLAGWVDPVESRNGRDVTEWIVKPEVHSVFAVRAAEEKARRTKVKETIIREAKSLGIKVKAA